MTKTLKDFLEVYKPKSPDEQKFVDKHVTIKHKDRNGNGDDVFNGNTKYIKRKEERHGYDVGDDEKVYEEVEDLDELSQKMVRAYRDKARDDKESAEDEREYYKAHDDNTDDEDEKIRKRSAGIKMASKKIHGGAKVPVKEELEIEALLDEALDLLLSIDEKTLTPAEMKKREEVVKAIKRGNPKMDKSMAYAIATKTAKRVAEGVVPTADEPSEHDKKMAQKVRDLLAKEKKPVKEDLDEAVEVRHDRYMRSHGKKASGGGAWMFTHKASGEAKGDDTFTAPATAKTFTDAAKHAKAWAKSKGHRSVYVMEEVEDLDEGIQNMSDARLKFHVTKNLPHGSYTAKEIKDEHERRRKTVPNYHTVKPSLSEEAEQIDELSRKTVGSAGSKALRKALGGDEKHFKYANLASAKMYPDQYKKSPLRAKVPANEEVEELDELSIKKLTDYTAAASDARRHRGMPTAKLDNRYKGVMRAGDKINKGFSKVHATEEVENLEELSKKTLSSYAKKAVNQTFSKGVAGGMGLASSNKEDEASGHRQVNKAAKRMAGAQKAISKLTKEDIINRTINKYVPEEMKFTPEERLLQRLDGLSESHVNTLFGLFEQLNSDNQTKMLHTCETIEGINSLLDFALQNRGE